MKTYRRRKYFIDWKFQTKYIILTVLMLLVYTFILMGVVFSPYIFAMVSGGSLQQQAEAARTLLDLHGRVWPGVGVAIILFGGFSIFVSHKVAGPVYRLKKGLKEIAGGNLGVQIHLRQWDDLKDLADCTNQLAKELRTFVAALHDNQGLLLDYLHELEAEVEKKAFTPEEGRELIERVQAGIARNREIMERFQL
ncbi:hypothetical protein [Trichloromonas sp.]|uniref:hypothetical protein n=1 Tax=Trichloromonas sp. TaxID=3069249 RepID=UPI003D8129EB